MSIPCWGTRCVQNQQCLKEGLWTWIIIQQNLWASRLLNSLYMRLYRAVNTLLNILAADFKTQENVAHLEYGTVHEGGFTQESWTNRGDALCGRRLKKKKHIWSFRAFFHSGCERDGRDNGLSGPRLVS